MDIVFCGIYSIGPKVLKNPEFFGENVFFTRAARVGCFNFKIRINLILNFFLNLGVSKRKLFPQLAQGFDVGSIIFAKKMFAYLVQEFKVGSIGSAKKILFISLNQTFTSGLSRY